MKHRRRNSKIIALIVILLLLLSGGITLLILDNIGVKLNYIPILIVTGVLVFSLLMVLSLIRYDSLREIRTGFKETNLPLYTDSTSLLGHDIKDENKEDKE